MTHTRGTVVVKIDRIAKVCVVGWARYFFKGAVASIAVTGGAVSDVCVVASA